MTSNDPNFMFIFLSSVVNFVSGQLPVRAPSSIKMRRSGQFCEGGRTLEINCLLATSLCNG